MFGHSNLPTRRQGIDPRRQVESDNDEGSEKFDGILKSAQWRNGRRIVVTWDKNDFHKLPPVPPHVIQEYGTRFGSLSCRSDPRNPHRFIGVLDAARMAQLIECFPEGVEVNYFLKRFEKTFNKKVVLNGFAFPKDSDQTVTFKLPFLWIPDHEEIGLTSKLIFPKESERKYKNCLRNVLKPAWEALKNFFEEEELVIIDEVFDLLNDSAEFYRLTGIDFDIQRWDMNSYVAYVQLLLRNFDPDGKEFKVVKHAYKDDNMCLQYHDVVFPNKKKLVESFERQSQLERKAQAKHGSRSAKKAEVEKAKVELNGLFDISPSLLFNQRDLKGNRTIVAAGNIKQFQPFFAILSDDVGKQDELLQKIESQIKEEEKQGNKTKPVQIHELMLCVYKRKSGQWARAMVTEMHGDERVQLVTILDFDRGELLKEIKADAIWNMSRAVGSLKVYTTPCRFSLRQKEKQMLSRNPEANSHLGKLLHQMLLDPQVGLHAKFYFFEKDEKSPTGGAWVISGCLVNAVEGVFLRPKVSLGSYLLRRFERNPREELPFWEDEVDEDDWSPTLMENRTENITKAIGLKKMCNKEPGDASHQKRIGAHRELGIRDEECKEDEDDESIFQNFEFEGEA